MKRRLAPNMAWVRCFAPIWPASSDLPLHVYSLTNTCAATCLLASNQPQHTNFRPWEGVDGGVLGKSDPMSWLLHESKWNLARAARMNPFHRNAP
jgi:hypothetical protein